MAGNINFLPCSCSFRLFSSKFNDDDQEPNFRSQSFSQESFNSSFSSRSSLPSSISALLPSSTTLQHHCISTFKPNSSRILSLTLSEENQLFIGSSTHIHLLNDNKFVSIPCNSAVKSLHILNEDILITAHQDQKIRIWRINNKLLKTGLWSTYDDIGSEFQSHQKNMHDICHSDKNYNLKIITTLPTLKDRLTKFLFAKNYVTIRRHKKLTWIHHIDAVSSLAISKDKSLIYSASWDRSFKVWRVSDFKCLESVSNAHDDAINAIVLSNEDFVYTGSADNKIKVWKYNQIQRKHELISSLLHHKSAVNALAYDDGSSSCILISGACSGVMIASERKFSGDQHMVVIGALLGHKKAILCVKVVKELVCSGSADKTVRLWRRTMEGSYSCLGVLDGHGGPVKCLALAPESSSHDSDSDGRGYMVYTGGLDGDIKVWKVWVPNL